MRVHLFERESPEYEAHAAGEALEQHLHGRLRLLAIWTLEVAVLDYGGHCVRRADHMIDGSNRLCELERYVRPHDIPHLPATMRPPGTCGHVAASLELVSSAKTQLAGQVARTASADR